MKFRNSFLLSVLLFFFSFVSTAQDFQNPGEYMDYIGKSNETVTEKYLYYLSAVSHGKSARKVEKRREGVLSLIYETRLLMQAMPPFKGDKSYRDSTVAYLKILYSVFNEDYGKIVNMEEIAEQSYDAMEAYMLAQDKAQEKLKAAAEKRAAQQKVFAAKNNITLVENKSDLDNKMEAASQITNHYDEVYLAFFKPYKQEAYLLDAVNKKNIIAIEQNLSSLKQFAEEGLEKLKTINSPNGDASVIAACRSLLQFYKTEAKDGAGFTDYFLKEEEFKKLKKEFDSKSSSKRTQADIDKFNNAVNDINDAGKNYNNINNSLNKTRASLLDDWNKAVKKFMDNYIPVQR